MIVAVPHPDVLWYNLNGMSTQKRCKKSSSDTFSIHVSHKNWIKYGLQILKNKNIFKRHKYPSSNALNIKYLEIFGYH